MKQARRRPDVVAVGQTYSLAGTLVSLVFTSLPPQPGTLTMQQVTLTPEQMEDLGAFSTTAYDITSSMENGTFTYDLTLPVPPEAQGQTIEVKAGASIEEVSTVHEAKEQAADTITIKGLNHFTVFVLVNDVEGDDAAAGTQDDVANGNLAVIADTFADENNPDTNFTADTHIQVRSRNGGRNKRGFVQFDTSALPVDALISSATLRLLMNNAPPADRTLDLFRVESAWDENTLTWNNQPSVAGIPTASTTTDLFGGVWLEWDVTADVQGFLDGTFTNFGWSIWDSFESESSTGYQTGFRSSGPSTPALRRPQLVVDFATPATSPTQYNSPVGSDDGGSADILFPGSPWMYGNYGFSIPDGSTINGIEVRADWNLDGVGGINSLLVELSYDGGLSWTAPYADITETNVEHISTFGGSTDTWGRSWQASEFSDLNFLARVTGNATNCCRVFFLDWLPIRVYYTLQSTTTTTSIGGPGDGRSDGRSDGKSDGRSDGHSTAPALTFTFPFTLDLVENVLGATNDATGSAEQQISGAEEITLENVLGEEASTWPWWVVVVILLLLAAGYHVYKKKK